MKDCEHYYFATSVRRGEAGYYIFMQKETLKYQSFFMRIKYASQMLMAYFFIIF